MVKKNEIGGIFQISPIINSFLAIRKPLAAKRKIIRLKTLKRLTNSEIHNERGKVGNLFNKIQKLLKMN